MEFKHAMQVFGEKGIYFKVDNKNMTLSFYTYAGRHKVKLWVITDGQTAIQDFEMTDYDDMIKIIEDNASREMLIPFNMLKIDQYDRCCVYCGKSDEELDREMWNEEYEKQNRDDYQDRYHDLMTANRF